MRSERRAALLVVWHSISVLLLAILLTPCVVTSQDLGAVLPACEWKARYHRECAFCGMTSAFYEIGNGHLAEAESLNRGSVPLYAAFVLNEIVLLGYWMKKRQQRRSGAADAVAS